MIISGNRKVQPSLQCILFPHVVYLMLRIYNITYFPAKFYTYRTDATLCLLIPRGVLYLIIILPVTSRIERLCLVCKLLSSKGETKRFY